LVAWTIRDMDGLARTFFVDFLGNTGNKWATPWLAFMSPHTLNARQRLGN
jgi:hypothetical protein